MANKRKRREDKYKEGEVVMEDAVDYEVEIPE